YLRRYSVLCPSTVHARISLPQQEASMIKDLMSSRRFAPLFWAQFCAALNDNVLKNALVIMLLYGATTGHGDALVTVAGAVFIFPFFILSGLGGELADKFVKGVVARRIKFAEIFAACFAA